QPINAMLDVEDLDAQFLLRLVAAPTAFGGLAPLLGQGCQGYHHRLQLLLEPHLALAHRFPRHRLLSLPCLAHSVIVQMPAPQRPAAVSSILSWSAGVAPRAPIM